MKSLLSPKELAEAIGVSESSLKRWADDGRIRAARTAGGHRRIPLAEAVRFIRETQTPIVRPDILGLAEMDSSGPAAEPDAVNEQLFQCLHDGLAREARGLVLSLYLRGQSIASICDGPLREAMARIGELWDHGQSGIVVEHRATDICIQAISQLRLIIQPSDEGPLAVGGAPSGDPYLLPSLVAATVLAGEGYRTINLGPDTPFYVLRQAVEEYRPRLVWVSVSVAENAEKLLQDGRRLVERLRELDVRLVVGGQARKSLGLTDAQGAYIGASMGELAAFARGLRSGGGEAGAAEAHAVAQHGG